jgi:predicted O-methyltransferase YrrM
VLSGDVIAQLERDRPVFHVGGAVRWDVSSQTLRMIGRHLRPGMDTLEIGIGASTVLFAASGSSHMAVGVVRAEFEAVAAYCESVGISTSDVTFCEGMSENVLPTLSQDVDLALIDGAHGFPAPTVDFAYVRRLMRPGAVLVLDDVPIPTVASVYEFLRSDSHWEQLEIASDRAISFRMTSKDDRVDPWVSQALNRHYPDFSFLPLHRRVMASSLERLASSQALHDLRERSPAAAQLAARARRLLR